MEPDMADPLHCDVCGCALHDSEQFNGQDVCDPCLENERDRDSLDDQDDADLDIWLGDRS
jgi:predicted nucleic acid-binding Zn ribbon protein